MKIYFWNSLGDNEKCKILSRPALSCQKNIGEKTAAIIEQVKTNGDAALMAFAEQYDRVKLDTLTVSAAELTEACDAIDLKKKQAIEFAKNQIETYHRAQLPKSQRVETCQGVICEREARAIEKIGLYVPGGSASLVSTLLMLAVPAKLAGCAARILCTPCDSFGKINPAILYAATLCDIKYIYKIGGAQAIAAMAYGTTAIPKVNKIFGPGNAWVTQAKVFVAQDPGGVAIDMPAGPSEIMVIADDSATPEYIAADLLSQAEHGVDSQVMLITLSENFAKQVQKAIADLSIVLPRNEIIQQSLAHSRIIIADSIEQAINISNAYAPEHLILHINHPEKYKNSIQNAGAVFIGPWSPETVGDYVTGSNHVLPTYGYAKNYSGLSVMDFMKWISFQTVSREGLENIGPYAATLADIEGLHAHKLAVTVRLMQEVLTS